MKKVIVGILAMLLIALVIGGWVYGFFNRRVSVGSINKDPTAFEGQHVIVTGKVTGRLALGSFSMYYLGDGTGQIRVRGHDGSLPKVDETVTVRGTVNSLLKLGDVAIGTTIDEQQRW
jgi:hypothetical protein